MLVQTHPLVDPFGHQWPQIVQSAFKIEDEWIQVERRTPIHVRVRAERRFAEVDLAARAPRHDLRGTRVGEPLHRVGRHLGETLGVASGEMIDPAAIRWPAMDPVVDAERIQDIEAQKRDMRRLEDVAPCIEYYVWRAHAFFCVNADLAKLEQQLGRQLKPRQHAHTSAHLAKPVGAGFAYHIRTFAPSQRNSRERQHEARVDALGARRDTVPAASAHARPPRRELGPGAGAYNVDHARRDGLGVGRINSSRPRHWAYLDTFAASGAVVERRVTPSVQCD